MDFKCFVLELQVNDYVSSRSFIL